MARFRTADDAPNWGDDNQDETIRAQSTQNQQRQTSAQTQRRRASQEVMFDADSSLSWDAEDGVYTAQSANPYQGRFKTITQEELDDTGDFYSRERGSSQVSYNPYLSGRDNQKKGPGVGCAIAVFLLLVLILGGGFAAIQGMRLYNSARDVRSDARLVLDNLGALTGDIKDQNQEALAAHVQEIQQATQRMQDETSKPIWNLAAHLPGIGKDIRNVYALVSVLGDLTDNALVPYSEGDELLTMGKIFEDGQVNVENLQNIVSLLGKIEPVLGRTVETVQDLEPGRIDEVNTALTAVQDSVIPLHHLAGQAGEFVELIPQLFGSEETRYYIVCALNTAEVRPGGGAIGSLGLLTVNNGHLEMGEFHKPGLYDPSEVALTDDQWVIANTNTNMIAPNLYTINSTLWPDFAQSAQVIRAHYTTGNADSPHISGVFGIDPIFLQFMLQMVGPVSTSYNDEVNGNNAARFLLNRVYVQFLDPDEQDAYFTEIADLAFHKIMNSMSQINPLELARVFGQGASGRHLEMWLEDEAEQAFVRELGASGEIRAESFTSTIGIYHYCIPASKLMWYMERNAEIVNINEAEGTVEVRATYTNHLSESEVANLPAYIVSHDNPDDLNRKAGDMTMQIFLYAPTGATITEVTNQYFFENHTIDGFDVWIARIKVEPGQTQTVSFTVKFPNGIPDDISFDMTPSCQDVIERVDA